MSTVTPQRLQSALADLLSGSVPERDAVDDRILDAALALLDEHGTRMSMNDLAARADVSRATLFRRFAGKDEVITQVVAREFVRVTARLQATVITSATPREGLERLLAQALEIGATHPLIQRVARYEPQALAQIASRGNPSPFDLGRAFLAAVVANARGKRSREPSPERVADVLLHLLLGYLTFPDTTEDLGSPDGAQRLAASLSHALV